MTFAEEIVKDRGQPAIVRVGTVTGPSEVTVQGTALTGLGWLNGDMPEEGTTVAVLGQSAVSADGSTWLCLGSNEPFATSGGVRFLSDSQQLTWNDNVEHDIPGFTFEATLRANNLYRLQCEFMVRSNSGSDTDFPLVRLYQGTTVLYQRFSNTQPGSANTYNNIEIYLRQTEEETVVFKLTAERTFGASEFVLFSQQFTVFALFDVKGSGLITDIA